jgi:Protein of unknown function (DUF3984)
MNTTGMAPAPLFSLDDFDSYDGDIETGSSYTGTDAFATPSFAPTPFSSSPVRYRAPPTPDHAQLQQRLSAMQKYDELNMPQVSNRSNSTLTFSPGPHRRSHPNLQHLSLAPLTPKYPITPSDYTAYVDPDTSQLHTSSSLSHIASMPSPSGILSRADGQGNSRTRHRKSKSSVSIQVASNTPRGALTSQGFGGKMTDSPDLQNRQRPIGAHLGPKKNDSSWLLQTGMALTEGSRESKGQSWLSKRASSTSLHSPVVEDYPNFEYAQARSGRGTPNHSRRGSRDRRKSRRELAMTPAARSASSAAAAAGADDPHVPRKISIPASTHDYAKIEPDWADSQTQAEIAADLEMELAEELEDDELYSDDGDRFDTLDFEGQGVEEEEEEEEEEEKEIQQAVCARGFGLGRWVDGVVDVFLKMDDADEDELDPKQERQDHDGVTLPEDGKEDKDLPRQSSMEEMDDIVSEDGMEPAPENPKTVWEDIAWFGRLVLRTAKS